MRIHQTSTEGLGATPLRGAQYRILHKLGVGGMGVVYAADDVKRQRRVALKFPTVGEDGPAASLRRIRRERAAIQRLQNPHVCMCWGVSTFAEQPCLVLEYLEGADLRQHMNGRTLATSDVLRIVDQVADALCAIHDSGLIHGDIKPTNVFVTSRGVVKILDFGLAAPIGGGMLPPGTAADAAHDALFGTANYMAPERILRRPQTAQSDLFALGALFYEMLTGRPPHAGATTAETIFNVLDQPLTPVSTLAPERGSATDCVVAKLLAKRPADRYRSADAFRRALRRLGVTGHKSALGVCAA